MSFSLIVPFYRYAVFIVTEVFIYRIDRYVIIETNRPE
jgi:hypothetical protein